MEGTKDRVRDELRELLVSRTAAGIGLHLVPPPSERSRGRGDVGEGVAPPLEHRWADDRYGGTYCLDCMARWVERRFPCATEQRRCESCRQHPAAVWIEGFAVCGPCANGATP